MLADITYEISRGFLVGIAAKETVEGNEKDGGKAKDRIETWHCEKTAKLIFFIDTKLAAVHADKWRIFAK